MSERGMGGGSSLPSGGIDDESPVYYGGATRPTTPSGAMGQGGQPDQGGSGAGQAMGQAGHVADQAKEKATQVADTAKEKATQAADTAKEKAGQVADQVSTKADAGIDKAAGGLDKAADMLRERSEQMGGGQGGAVQSIAGQAATQLDGAAQFLKDKDTDQLMADLEDLVRRKPTQTLLVAAGVGFLLSKVVR